MSDPIDHAIVLLRNARSEICDAVVQVNFKMGGTPVPRGRKL
jgi:hypothetical protein